MKKVDPFVIVIGFDGSKQSHEALAWGVEEARYRNAELRVLTVWNKAPMAWYPAMLETAAGEIVAEDSPEQQAEALGAEAAKSAVGVNVVTRSIKNDSAAAREADLVIVGSRGHGGFAGLHIGSVSAQVASHSPCPVLVIRPKAS